MAECTRASHIERRANIIFNPTQVKTTELLETLP